MATSPNIRLLKLGFSADSPSRVAQAANIVIGTITSGDCKIPLNAADPDLPTLIDLQAQHKKVINAVALPDGAPAKEARKSERDDLVNMLQRLGTFYEGRANGDRVLLSTTGFELKKEPARRSEGNTPIPTNFHVRQSSISCRAIGKCKVDKSVVNIGSQWSLQSEPTSPEWIDNGLTTKSQSILFNNLPRGKDVYFRCQAHGSNGASGWSDIATLMII